MTLYQLWTMDLLALHNRQSVAYDGIKSYSICNCQHGMGMRTIGLFKFRKQSAQAMITF